MKKFRLNKKLAGLVFLLVLIAVAFNFFYKRDRVIVYAGTGDNVSGFAWSENIGWISFNSTDCDQAGGFYTGTPVGCPSAQVFDYGVNIDTATGNFSGYAWSENIGWISFNRKTCNGGIDEGKFCVINNDCAGGNQCRDNVPGAAGDPPSDPYSLSSFDYIANYDSDTGEVTGWAKVLVLGDDGWIKLSGGSATLPTAGLIGHWTLDEVSGTLYDSTANNNNGANNGATCGVSGISGNACQFNGSATGDNYISITDPGVGSVLDFSDDDSITLSAWVNASSFASGYTTILAKGKNYGLQALKVDDQTARLNFYYRDSNDSKWVEYQTTDTFQINTVNYLALSYTFGNKNSIASYINGALKTGDWAGGTGNEAPLVNNNNLKIGNTSNEEWNGIIDDVKIYNRILSQPEITALYEGVSSAYGVNINETSKEFSGWAWNGNATTGTGIGWISFNCADTGAGGCAGHDYKVRLGGDIPDAPTNLTTTPTCSTIKLEWDHVASGEDGFEAEYSTTANGARNTIPLCAPGAGIHQCTFSAPEGTTLYYWVRAYNASGPSAWEPVGDGIAGATPYCPPTLSATDNCGSILVEWRYNNLIATYNLYRSVDGGAISDISASCPNISDKYCNDTDISSASTYEYYIVSSDGQTSNTDSKKPCSGFTLPRWREVKP